MTSTLLTSSASTFGIGLYVYGDFVCSVVVLFA